MNFCASPAIPFLSVVILRYCAMHPNTSLTGKHLVDSLLVITELVSVGVNGCSATSEYQLKVAVFGGGRSFTRKISRRSGRPTPTICAGLGSHVNA